MHKSTKLTPTLRREVYDQWINHTRSLRDLARSYHVDKHVISRVLARGKLKDFSVHDSTNRRYRTIEFGIKRLAVTERWLAKRDALKKALHLTRYEKSIPGEMVHGDTKRLPNIPGLHTHRISPHREVLFVAIDDATRFLVADILPDKTMWSASLFLETTFLRLPFKTECYYSDNGGEYKGNKSHAVSALCTRMGIMQRFTKPRHPWTNGKAERVIRTLLTEWYRKTTFTSYEQRRQSLYAFVEQYNHHRTHMGLHGLTPMQRLTSLLGGDNAC